MRVYGFNEELWVRLLEIHWKSGEKDVETILRVLREFGVEGGDIIDLGCGIGRLSVRLALRGYRVLGIDLSPLCIVRAKSLARRYGVENKTEFIVGDYYDLEKHVKGQRKIRAALNFQTVSWKGKETADKLVKLYLILRRFMKDGGLLIIQEICRELLVKAMLAAPTILRWFREYDDLLYLNKWSYNPKTSTLASVKRIYEASNGHYRFVAEIRRESYIPSILEYRRVLESSGWEVINVNPSIKVNMENFGEYSENPWLLYSFTLTARKR